MMKKIAISIVCPLIGVFLLASCMGEEEEIEKSSAVALLSFGIKDLKTVHEVEDTDSVCTTVMSGKTVQFTIDQDQQLVYNVDSIAYGTNVSRVLVEVTADGFVGYLKEDGQIGSVEDSIDFASPVTFRVTSYDERFTRDYRVSINVHKVDPKKTVWTKIANVTFPADLFAEQKAFVKGDSLYVIGNSSDGTLHMASAALAADAEWSTNPCSGIIGNADCMSAMLVGDTFCLTADGVVYYSADAVAWTSANNPTSISTLLAFEEDDIPVFWSVNEKNMMSSVNMETWTVNQYLNIQIARGVASFCAPLRTNEHIMRTVFVATPVVPDTCAQVWTKLSTEPDWIQVEPKGGNVYGCPNLENLTVIRYAGKMYAFGGVSIGDRKKPLEAFSACYESRDNGVTWKGEDKRYEAAFSLSGEFKGRTEAFSATTDGEYVWVIWSNGEVWRGRWNGIK